MITRLLVLAGICSLSQGYLAQRDYCNSNAVVKAKILPPGTIAKSGNPALAVLPELPPYYRRFEIEIEEVFKSQMAPLFAALLKGSKHHAISKDTSQNIDADGCDFYQRDPRSQTTLIAMLRFDSWNSPIELKSSCKGWTETSDFERNALREQRYNCDCEIEECVNRVDGQQGVPTGCSSSDLESIACDKDEKGRCIWKGAKKTCVNPISKQPPLSRKRGPPKFS